MAEYYFDTETTGLDSHKDKIITIQWQELDIFTGKPIGDLQILKEWESSEKEILEKFLPKLACYHWDFVFIGKNLLFDFMFLDKRLKHHNLGEFDLSCAQKRVVLDIKPILVMINRDFIGYDRVFDKNGTLDKVNVPELYEQKNYPTIIKYIEEETKVFIKNYQILKEKMPLLLKHFQRMEN